MENVPQTILVSLESFLLKYTIRVDQLAFPIFGLITAALTFATHIGDQFKAAHEYIYFDDFKIQVPENLYYDGKEWH